MPGEGLSGWSDTVGGVGEDRSGKILGLGVSQVVGGRVGAVVVVRGVASIDGVSIGGDGGVCEEYIKLPLNSAVGRS